MKTATTHTADGPCRIAIPPREKRFSRRIASPSICCLADIWSGFWPKAPSSPLANSLNAATKYVATHRPDCLGWGPFEGLGPDIVEGVRRIKAMDGPSLILWGSSTLTSMLLEHGLADEVLLFVYPVLLGKGKRFFSDVAPPSGLALASTDAVSSGVLISTYTPAGPLRPGFLDNAAT
jgi:dihydrofolate reductase